MSDQRNTIAAAILAAIDRVNRSIQRTQTYIDANTFPLIGQGTAETAGSSGTLSFLGVITVMPGITSASSNVEGDLDISKELTSSVGGVSDIDASLDSQPGLGSSVIEISGAGGALGYLDVLTVMRGSAAGVSDLTGFLNHHLFSGESDGEGEATAYLNSEIGLVGSCDGESSGVGEAFLR